MYFSPMIKRGYFVLISLAMSIALLVPCVKILLDKKKIYTQDTAGKCSSIFLIHKSTQDKRNSIHIL